MPNYEFHCSKCDKDHALFIKMSEYKSDGNVCPECGEEMNRKVENMVCGVSIDKTGSFYRKNN